MSATSDEALSLKLGGARPDGYRGVRLRLGLPARLRSRAAWGGVYGIPREMGARWKGNGVARRRRPVRIPVERLTSNGRAAQKGRAMIQAADVREWRDHVVVDVKGHKIGVLEAVYVDTATDAPTMATVRAGLPTRQHLLFVPLDDAIVGPGYLKVSYPKSLVKQAPSIGTDDILPAEEEEAIFQHYGMTYQAGAGGERRLARR
jgi:hypothetical protein